MVSEEIISPSKFLALAGFDAHVAFWGRWRLQPPLIVGFHSFYYFSHLFFESYYFSSSKIKQIGVQKFFKI